MLAKVDHTFSDQDRVRGSRFVFQRLRRKRPSLSHGSRSQRAGPDVQFAPHCAEPHRHHLTEDHEYTVDRCFRGFCQSQPVGCVSQHHARVLLRHGALRAVQLERAQHVFRIRRIRNRIGKHNLRAGGSANFYQLNLLSSRYPLGSYHFDSSITSLPGIVNTGDAFASFLIGGVQSAEQSVVTSPSYFRRSLYNSYLQDKFDVLPGLTITGTLGLQVSTPRVEKYNRQSTVDLNVLNPANELPGALVAAGVQIDEGTLLSFPP